MKLINNKNIMNKKEVKEFLLKYGFTVNENQVNAIVEIFKKTTLTRSEQNSVLKKYAQESLVGVINIAVENNVKTEDK